MRKNFVCIYCSEVHPMECATCPRTDMPLSPAHKLSLSTLDDKYAINKVIGVGGMGVIYDAESVESGRRVAIKFLNPVINRSKDAYERFSREAKAAAMISHHNIVHVLDIGTTSFGLPFIVMEHLKGQDLGTRITDCKSFPMTGAAGIVAQVLETLSAVHAEGIVHRDLKPENIFLVEHPDIGEYVKLLDFGIARLTVGEGRTLRLTASGQVFGTPYYVSPEQALGDLAVDHRSDLYSVGVIFFEMLTGRLPFHAEAFGRIILNIMIAPIPDPRTFVPTLPAAAVDFIFAALARQANDRFQSAGEMLRELLALDLGGIEPVETPAGRIKTPTPGPPAEARTQPKPGAARKTPEAADVRDTLATAARGPVPAIADDADGAPGESPEPQDLMKTSPHRSPPRPITAPGSGETPPPDEKKRG